MRKKKLIKKSNKQNKRLIFDKTKEKENITNKIPYKRRDPYIDCIRILGMYAIIIHHCLLHGKILQKYGRYKQLSLMNTFCHWHVSSFALVSGIVGYKTSKYSNLLFIWLCTLFYSITIYYALKKYKPFFIGVRKVYDQCYPIIFYKYWYVTSYFGMYFFFPCN